MTHREKRRAGEDCLKSARDRVTGETAKKRIAQPEDRLTRYTPSIINPYRTSYFVAKISCQNPLDTKYFFI
jgi:hypothetical protein